MSLIGTVTLALGVFCLLCAGIYGISVNRTQEGMERMLDRALSGSFHEESYDESTLSRMEQKLARFLASSRLTVGKVEEERAAVKALIGEISHQVKTPLSNILLYAQLLGEQDLPASAKPLCGQIGVQAEKLRFLIGSLVKTSRLESGSIQVRPARNDVGELLDALSEQYRPQAQEKEILLCVTPVSMEACFDPRWTAEAVGNIIDNAVKYTPEGGSVYVTAEEYLLFAKITVKDSGPGIPEEEHAQVFERFYRGRDASQEGVGLGLFLSRQVIASQGGYIRLISAPGKGAEFSVFLPRKDEEL